jgi:hypothetical protein
MSKKLASKGFGAIETLVVIAIITLVGFGGYFVWHNHQGKKTTNATKSQTSDTTKTKAPTIDPYTNWKTYTDTGYSVASGIIVKYPSTWKVNIGDSKAFAWEIVEGAPPQTSINVRDTYLDNSQTAQQEWDNCSSADACGPSAGDTKLEGNTSTINGLDVYSVKMQNSSGVYYATVAKSNKTTSKGTVFVEFLINNPSTSALDTYKQIIASVSF